MRLTLRTMLAYLDGILEPEDAQNIAKKIEESTFASDLIHRIRYLLMRPSMTEPSTPDSEPALGPNTMAEYLDNTLPPDRVTEFEKICLDTDAHLAEVSACHQILTLVLGEPAEIDPASRQRMYDIPSHIATTDIPLPGVSESETMLPPPMPSFTTSSIDSETERKLRPKPAIPDYLREPVNNYRWVSFATVGIVGVCLAIVLLLALGRFEPGTVMGNMLVRLGFMAEKKEIALKPNKTAPQQAKNEANLPAKHKTEQKAVVEESKPSIEASKTAESGALAAQAEKPSPAEPPPAAADGSGKTKTVPASGTPAKDSAISSEVEADKGAGQGKDSKSAPLAADQNPDQNAPAKQSSQKSKEPSEGDSATPPQDSSGTKPTEEKAMPPSERLGRYMSEDQILLKYSAADTDWRRAASKAFLSADEQLLALPTYRPEITLGAGVNLRILGGTQLELVPAIDAKPAGIKIRFGRLVAMPLANPGTRLRIIIGRREGVVTFTDPEAVLAVDVRRIHSPGLNPETESPPFVIEFFATTGHILWDETGQKTLEIAGPAHFTIHDQSPAELVASKDFPKWITAEPIGKLDRDSSSIIAQSLMAAESVRPAGRGLMELTEHRRKEVRWLAIRCLGYIGNFDSMVKILGEADFKPDWSDYIEQLREAVGRDPETAATVRKSLENRYPQISADLYRMLWGYTDKDLESGDDEKLVKSLENDNLAVRVLSFWNLKEITAGMGLFYQPEQTAAKRQQPIQGWKKRLEAKEIRIKSTEEKAGNAEGENATTPPNGNE